MTESSTLPLHPQHAGLSQGLLALGLSVPEATQAQLLAYLDLLGRWNKVYNLTAVRRPEEMLVQHLLDCLAVVTPMSRALAALPTPRILDVGSGGGLPGVVLAILHPQWQVACVDTVGKKASFIRQVAAELGLKNLQALHARVETLEGPGYDMITSRAFASLEDFVSLTTHLLAPAGVWCAMKARLTDDEKSAVAAEVFHVEHINVPQLDAERCLVWMRPR